MAQYGFIKDADRLFPPMVVVEATNVCNLRCVHCAHPRLVKTPHYRPHHMKWELYTRIADEAASHPGTIFRLACDGEPLCHPRFIDMLKYADACGIAPLTFNTNGTLMNEDKARGVLGITRGVVEFSLDAISKEAYEAIRVGADYDTVMANIHRFIELRDRLNPGVKVMVSIIVQPESDAERARFLDYWKPRVDHVLERKYIACKGELDPSKERVGELPARWPCKQLWTRFNINPEGLAEFCTDDWHDRSVIGDVREQSIAAIWRGEAYEKLRRLHLSGKFEEVPFCSACTDWRVIEWDYDYFRAVNKAFGKAE
jgi:MoaA/NifB/PqqE/SkfB family radical SAM enzyme